MGPAGGGQGSRKNFAAFDGSFRISDLTSVILAVISGVFVKQS